MRVKAFIEKIIKIIKYLPVLWKDEDWDFEFLLLLIKFKITRMRDCIYKNNIIVPHERRRIFIGMNQAINHIDNYLQEFDVYEQNNKLPFNYEYRTEPNSNGTYGIKIYNTDENRALNEQEDKLYNEYLINAYKWQQNEWNLIFDTIKSEGENWWE